MPGGLLFSSAHIMSKHLGGRVFKSIKLNRSWLCRSLSNNQQPPQVEEPPIPPYVEKHGEDREVKRARLLYQSRKRGMTENGLLLSTFAAKYLDGFDDAELKIYDKLINQPSNDWEIYYWVTGAKPTPAEFESDIMNLLKKHTQNVNKDVRSTQPPLH